MYAQHFQFAELPFSIAPDPRYLYLSDQHREALGHLLYGILVGGGFVVLTGEVGTGKTTLCRCLVEQLPEDVDLALIFNPRLNPRELLAAICDELHVAYPEKGTSLKTLIDRLNRHLLETHARGRRTIVLIDEAQNLRFDVLEQIRLLTNLETNRDKLLQIILVGQPELNDLLARQNLRQLAQRITARFHLPPLSRSETEAYIAHRLAVSGVRTPLFSRAAMGTIHRCAGGIPRLVNLLCDRALLGAYARDKHKVDASVVRKAAREVLPPTNVRRLARGAAALSVGAAGLFLAGLLIHSGHIPLTDWLPGLPETEVATILPPAPAATPAPPPQASAPGVAPAETAAALAPVAPAPVSPPPEPATVKAASGDAPGLATPAPEVTFARFLADAAPTRDGAFAPLWPLWQIDPPQEQTDVCRFAERQGQRCLAGTSTWLQLRDLNRPAVLEFLAPDGDRRFAALLAVRGQRLELAVGDRRATFETGDVLPFWRGDWTMLWKPPAGYGKALKEGDRGAAVQWLRQQLGMPAADRDDYFDERLRARLVAFQKERGLTPDGVAGPSTLVHLAKNAENSAPRLDSSAP